MIVLLDSYTVQSQMLLYSLREAGYDMPAVSIVTDGFHPQEVTSPFSWFCGFENPNLRGRARFFNRLKVPDLWEIQSTGTQGEVVDYDELRARIFYAEPVYRRLIRAVDWLDRQKRVRLTDHYNRFGMRFAQTVWSLDGRRQIKTYFSPNGQVVIIENYITGNILLEEEGKTRIFANLPEFVIYFLQKRAFSLDRILYNSLSYPFFVSNRLGDMGIEGEDILFWEEEIGQNIPGNMQSILDHPERRTKKIAIQSLEAYNMLLKLGVDSDKIEKLGMIITFARENQYQKKALILTNSDEIEKLTTLVEELSQVQFTIAALTEMSAKLLSMDKYDNVCLLPAITPEQGVRLMAENDIYLDINYGNEILDALQMAFIHEQLIFAFQQTAHRRNLILPENIYLSENVADMIRAIQSVLEEKKMMRYFLDLQKKHAMVETPESYRHFLGDSDDMALEC